MNISNNKMLITMLIAISLILISGCTDKNVIQMPASQEYTDTATQTALIAYSAGELNLNPQEYTSAEISGTIIDTMNSGGYTYIRIDDGTGTIWVAGPETDINIGTEGMISGCIMKDFTSNTLGKTFETIVFSDAIQATVIDKPTNAKFIENPKAYDHVILNGIVNQTMDAPGYTYIELDDGTGMVWTAITQTNVTVGENVTINGNTVFEFQSQTLNKTFEVLIMGVIVNGDNNDEPVSEVIGSSASGVCPAF